MIDPLDSKNIGKLLYGSHFKSTDPAIWERARKFIAGAINREGTILDIGCANGYLLYSLRVWSGYKLVPYGIDTDQGLISEAKELFPKFPDNFIEADISDLYRLSNKGLPDRFNFIYWNVWDDWQFNSYLAVKPVIELLAKLTPGGRLILGFYDIVRENNLDRIEQLRRSGFIPSGVIGNGMEHEILCYFER